MWKGLSSPKEVTAHRLSTTALGKVKRPQIAPKKCGSLLAMSSTSFSWASLSSDTPRKQHKRFKARPLDPEAALWVNFLILRFPGWRRTFGCLWYIYRFLEEEPGCAVSMYICMCTFMESILKEKSRNEFEPQICPCSKMVDHTIPGLHRCVRIPYQFHTQGRASYLTMVCFISLYKMDLIVPDSRTTMKNQWGDVWDLFRTVPGTQF